MTSLRLCACALLLFGLSTLALAQDTGAITGTVHDPSGAVVPGAEVKITNPAGFNRITTSNSDGDYLAAALPGGTYDVSVTAKGFKTFSAKGVVLRVGQKARVDATLAAGAVETVVEVQGQNLNQVETQSSELAGTVTGKQMTQLELNGRNFTSLIQLTPGATNQSGTDEPGTGLQTVAYSVNGGRTEYNNYQVDGGSNQDDGSNLTLQVFPSLDSIAEFRVLTSNYGAQYGRNGSGTVELETKSGTSSFHGDVYEFVRNDDFNARNFFQSSVPAYKKNDYGYTIGGPIFIPGHYNKDKTKSFFFWSEEWRKDIVPQNFNTPVPSLAERGCTSATPGCVGTVGNFSELCPNLAAGSPDFSDCPRDPATGNFYPGNLVPIDPRAAGLVAQISLPNGGGPGAFSFQGSPSAPTNWREELIRLDHNINDKNRLSFHFIHDSWNNVFLTPTWTNGGSFPTITNDFIEPGVSLVTHLTTVASPTLLNEFVFGYSADHIGTTISGAWQRPANIQTLGFPGFNNGNRVPGFTFSGGIFDGITQDTGWVPNGPVNSNPQYEYRDNVSKIWGKHNFQFGGYLLASQKNELPQFEPSINGFFTFDTGSTFTTGNAFADLLTGNSGSFVQGNGQPKYHLRYKIFEPYLQDDWHVTQRLTLNLGVRLSFLGTVSDINHIGFNFDSGAYDPATAPQIDPNTGALVNGVGNPFDGIVQCGGPGGTGSILPSVLAAFPQATVGKTSDSCMKGHLFNPAPRLGFAFDPTGSGHTAIRGGYGIFWEHTNGNEATATQLEGSPPLVLTPGQSNIPGYSAVGTPGLFFPLTLVSLPSKAVWPYVQQWHLDVQHDFWKSTVATVSYVGSKGTHLGRRIDINQLNPVPAALNPYKPGEPIGGGVDASGNPLHDDCGTGTTPSGVPIPGAAAFNPSGLPTPGTPGMNLFVACGNSADPFRPFLGFSDIRRLENAASSNYNALQLSIRRTTGGLQYSFAYTYSHSIDDTSSGGGSDALDSYNPALTRGDSNFDQRHVFNISYIYDLPFFKNPGIAHTILGGWQWSGITSIETGLPYSVYNAGGGGGFAPGDNAGVGNGLAPAGSTVDVLSGSTGNPSTSVVGGCGPNGDIACFGPLFANPTQFVAPQGLTFGNAGRNTLRNPRQTNFDMGLFKHFPIHESIGLEFRAEAFNVFNHTEFGYISGGGGSAANNSGITAFSNSAACYGVGTNNAGDPTCLSGGFLRPAGAHNARILQLGMKLLF